MARDAPHCSVRAAARLANGFALDLVALVGFGRDVADAVLMMAISQANVAQITRSPELQRAYATLDQPPPDHLRRPVSVSAIAHSLRMPVETARRRIAALGELGVVKITPRGVIIPQAPLNAPFYRLYAEAHVHLVRELYFRLRAIGLLERLPPPQGPVFEPEHPPVRLVNRLSSDFLLRLAEPIHRHVGDVVAGLVLMGVVRANTEHLADSEAGGAGWSADDFVPDVLRRPVRAAALAERLGMADETVRRHLHRLVERDWCERAPEGYVVPSRILARDLFVQYMLDNQSHLQRLFVSLAEFGVLAAWEDQARALRGAA